MKLNLLFVLLIISCFTITNINSLKRQPCIAMESDANTNSTQSKKDDVKPFATANEESEKTAQNLGKSFINNLIKQLNPVFCYKNKNDISERFWATECPADKEINWTECRKKCRDDEFDVNGMCVRKCKSGYTWENKSRCWKATKDWYFPHRYYREAVPAKCPNGYILDKGGKCKKDCAWKKDKDGKLVKSGLINCGNHSCIDESKTTCTEEFNWTPDAQELKDLSNYAQKSITVNRSNEVKELYLPASRGLQEHGKHGILKTYESFYKTISGENGKALRDLAIQKTIEEYENNKIDVPLDSTVKTVCNAVFDNLLTFKTPTSLQKPDISGSRGWKTSFIEQTNKYINYGIYIGHPCQLGVNTNACIVEMLEKNVKHGNNDQGGVDYSNYIAYMLTFLNPECNMSYPKPPKHPQENKSTLVSLEAMAALEPGCAMIFQNANFKGDKKKLCKNDKKGAEGTFYVGNDMNDRTSSIIVGPGNDLVLFFKHSSNNELGRFLAFGSGSYNTDIHHTIDNGKMGDQISGVNFGMAQCALWQMDRNDNVFYNSNGGDWDHTKITCSSNKDDGYAFGTTDNFRCTVFNEKLQMTFYEKPDFKGKYKVLDDSYTLWDRDQKDPVKTLGFDKIESYELKRRETEEERKAREAREEKQRLADENIKKNIDYLTTAGLYTLLENPGKKINAQNSYIKLTHVMHKWVLNSHTTKNSLNWHEVTGATTRNSNNWFQLQVPPVTEDQSKKDFDITKNKFRFKHHNTGKSLWVIPGYEWITGREYVPGDSKNELTITKVKPTQPEVYDQFKIPYTIGDYTGGMDPNHLVVGDIITISNGNTKIHSANKDSWGNSGQKAVTSNTQDVINFYDWWIVSEVTDKVTK